MSKDRADDLPSPDPLAPDPSEPTQLDMFGAPVARTPRIARERDEKPVVRAKRPVATPLEQPALPIPRPGEAPVRTRKPKTVGRPMKEHELASPVDISDMPIDRGDSLRWASVTIAVASIALLCANAGTLSAWIDEKDPTPVQQRASAIAVGWTAAMDAIGITAPRHNLHEKWKTMQAARFGEEAPGGSQ